MRYDDWLQLGSDDGWEPCPECLGLDSDCPTCKGEGEVSPEALRTWCRQRDAEMRSDEDPI